MLRIEKVVGRLPEPLFASTLYFVRVGLGLDIYVTDNEGQMAHKVNVDQDQVLLTKLNELYSSNSPVTEDDTVLSAISKLNNQVQSLAQALSPSGAAAGTYTKVTVDTKGRVTSGAAMVAADIPALDTSKLTTGTLPVNRGGTGVAATTQGGILYGATTALGAFTAAGTSGQVLISNGTGAPTWQTLDLTYLPDSAVKKSVKVATTANITLSGLQTIDGVSCVAGDRVLVKNQTTTATNGIYVVSAAAWSRASDADTISKIAGAIVNTDTGTANGGFRFDTDIKTTDTLGTTTLTWNRSVDTGMAATVAGAALGVAAVGVSNKYAREDHVHAAPTTVTGNAATATKLATPRALNGINFDGSAAITIPVSVGNIAASSDLNTFQTAGFYSCPATATAASLLNCPTAVAFSLLVEKHAGIKQTITEYTTTGAKTYSRNFYSTWGAWYRVYTTIDPPTAVTGNAGTATKLATPRAINGIPFDGSADITLNLPMLGIGQSWADVSASRASGVTYTNSSNKHIEVMVTARVFQGAGLEITIGGVWVGDSSQAYYDGATVATTFIVPPNTTYKVTVTAGGIYSFKWSELS